MLKLTNRLIVAFALISLSPAFAITEDGGTCKQIDEVLAELREIRRILTERAPSPLPAAQSANATIDLRGVPFIGSKDAPITMVEFTDYQCPFCRRFYSGTFSDLRKRYIDSGKVRFYSMDFPLDIHSNALLAAQATHCALDAGKFWEMHDRMRSDTGELDRDTLLKYAQDLLIDPKTFLGCLDDGRFTATVDRSVSTANALGIHGTPTFVIGRSTEIGLDNGSILVGAVPITSFESRFETVSK